MINREYALFYIADADTWNIIYKDFGDPVWYVFELDIDRDHAKQIVDALNKES